MNDIELIMCPLCYAVENVKIDGIVTECPFCGKFCSDVSSRYLLTDCPEEFDDDWRLKTRHVVKKRHLERLKSNNALPFEDLSEPRLKEIKENYSVPGLLDKANLVLEYLVQKTNFFGDELRIDVDTLFPLFYCKNNAELYNILNFLSKSGLCSISDEKLFIEPSSGKYPKKHYMYNYNISDGIYKEHCEYLLYPFLFIVVTSKGIERVENKASSLASKQAFVAMWFNDKEKLDICHYDMQKVYKNAIEPAIITAEGKYTAMRIDYKEHCNDIND